uniref:Uncharacterized protein n=1 Tax=Physcomitrium patens TaxID=3218 RepID=A0A2K1JIN8_PHYPA|nr:hypothetical protein PHYPA_018824 [Physcomitrium patens]
MTSVDYFSLRFREFALGATWDYSDLLISDLYSSLLEKSYLNLQSMSRCLRTNTAAYSSWIACTS